MSWVQLTEHIKCWVKSGDYFFVNSVVLFFFEYATASQAIDKIFTPQRITSAANSAFKAK
jgi:hypothetical protein